MIPAGIILAGLMLVLLVAAIVATVLMDRRDGRHTRWRRESVHTPDHNESPPQKRAENFPPCP